MDDDEDYSKEMEGIIDRLMPYKRIIQVVCTLILIFLVVYMGFAYGAAKVCSQMDGVIDSKMVCHPKTTPNNKPYYPNENLLPVNITQNGNAGQD